MPRSVNLDRFGGAEPSDTEYSTVRCAYCSEYIAVGAEVRRTYECETVHDDCWRDYCDEIYSERRGYMGRKDID